jgi:hypothetical protein
MYSDSHRLGVPMSWMVGMYVDAVAHFVAVYVQMYEKMLNFEVYDNIIPQIVPKSAKKIVPSCAF